MVRELCKRTAGILFHAVLVATSAGVMLALPLLARWIESRLSAYWSLMGEEKLYLVSGETTVAILLILTMNYIYRSEKNRMVAKTARNAGLEYFVTSDGGLKRRKVRKLKITHGLGKNMMIIGVTGAKTLSNPAGDLYPLLENCLEAKIMLLNPDSAAAWARSKTLLIPDATIERFREEIRQTEQHLTRMRRAGKPISLKLYSDPPLFKLAVLGDHIWLQHYHQELDVQAMPQYVFAHNPNNRGLYTLFYQYFMKKWESPDIPEYDLETNRLLSRGRNTNGMKVRMPELETASQRDIFCRQVGSVYSP